MKLTFKPKTFSRLWSWRSQTLAGGDPAARAVGRTAAGQAIAVGTCQAAQVGCPWGAIASAVYLAGADQGESYA